MKKDNKILLALFLLNLLEKSSTYLINHESKIFIRIFVTTQRIYSFNISNLFQKTP